jgi:hypothetical protein
MDRKKQLIFKYFDMTFRGYKKHGRRPVNMKSPHVLFEYMDDNGRTAFEYNTEKDEIKFDYDDFYTAKNMFGIFIADLVDICKEYVAYKLDDPKLASAIMFVRNLNY